MKHIFNQILSKTIRQTTIRQAMYRQNTHRRAGGTITKVITITVVLALLSACGSKQLSESSEQELYEAAKKSIKLRNFPQATLALEELETRFPFGKYAEQAQLDLIYARYSGLDLEGSILAADRFIRLNPQSPNVDYAYYVRGIANYHLDMGVSAQYFTTVDISSRDPGHMRLAFRDFSELLMRFPDSVYASDAQQRMIAIRNRLAAYELHAARYYIKRQAYLAAVNRAAQVVKDFPATPSAEEALVMMVTIYLHLGLNSQSDEALSVLKANYPQGIGFDKNGEFESIHELVPARSLLSVITFGLLD